MSRNLTPQEQIAAWKAQGLDVREKAMAAIQEIVPEYIQPLEENRLAWTEKQFQSEVEKLAKANKWLTYHTWLSIKSRRGFPDLVLVRGPKLIFAELKKQKGRLSDDQGLWRDVLIAAGQTYYAWRPSDWESVVEVLA